MILNIIFLPGFRTQLSVPAGPRHGPERRGVDPQGRGRGPRHLRVSAQLQGGRDALLEPILRGRTARFCGESHQFRGNSMRGELHPNLCHQGSSEEDAAACVDMKEKSKSGYDRNFEKSPHPQPKKK